MAIGHTLSNPRYKKTVIIEPPLAQLKMPKDKEELLKILKPYDIENAVETRGLFFKYEEVLDWYLFGKTGDRPAGEAAQEREYSKVQMLGVAQERLGEKQQKSLLNEIGFWLDKISKGKKYLVGDRYFVIAKANDVLVRYHGVPFEAGYLLTPQSTLWEKLARKQGTTPIELRFALKSTLDKILAKEDTQNPQN